jgi:hypothetical protein
VGFDAVFELVEVGTQARGAFEAGEAFLGREQLLRVMLMT